MSEEKYKWLDATTRLVSLTQRGKINWTVADKSLRPPDVTSSEVYISNSTSQILRLYEANLNSERYKYLPLIQATLEIIDPNGTTIRRFPYNEAVGDLFEVVQGQSASVNKLLAELEAMTS